MDADPPLLETYKKFFDIKPRQTYTSEAEECDLPVIDLKAENCNKDIAAAAANWGFFQVVNHGVSDEILTRVHEEQLKLFRRPFVEKRNDDTVLCKEYYRWGTPTAVSLSQLSWFEAYHIPLVASLESSKNETRRTFEEFAAVLSQFAQQLAQALTEELGHGGNYFKENFKCDDACFLRINHYPPCPEPDVVHGLSPHTDSGFLTVLSQDKIGGLQLKKEHKWITVKPYPGALTINIGDLFMAWSNGVYKSVEHRVISNPNVERFSAAYFLCPSYDTLVQSPAERATAIYKKFTFGEYMRQVNEDIRLVGDKVGLSRFLFS